MTRNERKLKAVEDTMAKKAQEIQEFWDKETKEDRELTEEERGEVVQLVKALDELKVEKKEAEANIALEQEVKEASKGLGSLNSDKGGIEVSDSSKIVVGATYQKSLGEQFIESKGYKDAVEGMKTGASSFSSGAIPLETKGTLTETTGSGLALATTVPQVIPGVTDTQFQRLTVVDLIATGQATTSSLRYVVEGTATSGAKGIAEGESKPESTLALSTVDEPVKKIATSLTTSDEMLEDAAQVQSYINGRLSLFVNIEEEKQVLRGGGTNELVGITGRSGVNTYKRGTVDNNAIALFKVLNGTRGSSLLEPDAIIMNPANWQTTRLLMDKNEQLYGGGPFYGPYGGPQGPASASGQVSGALDYLWGKPVVVTTAIGSGTAVIGSFRQAAQLFYRGGLTVEASNSHEGYFLKNLVAIRAEKREALAVYRPSAFTVVSELA